MKFAKLAAVAALALSSLAANAATTTESLNFSYAGPDIVTGFSGTLTTGFLNGLTSFTNVKLDGLTTGVTELSGGLGYVFSIASGSSALSHNVSFNATAAGTPTYAQAFSFSTVSAGSTVLGSSVTTAAPVPEPETYAMLMAGLGAIGFMSRRRKVNNV